MFSIRFQVHTKLPRSQATDEELLALQSFAPSAERDGNGVDLNEMRAQIEAAASREANVSGVCGYVWPGVL